MRIICIEGSTFLTGSSKDQTAIHKGSIYHVTRVLEGGLGGEVHELIQNMPASTFPAQGAWYELLEVRGYHHSSKFLEVPSDLEECLEYTKQQDENEKISNEEE